MFDRGSGPPVVVIPGLQGRWEWMRPALGILAERCRTISYSLCGDIGSHQRVDPALGFDNHLRQIEAVLDEAGLERAAICGVSFGGFVALRFAATQPSRVSALILASAPAPGWSPSVQQARWLSRPWLSAPAFVLTSPLRLYPEVCTALSGWGSRLTFALAQTCRVAAAPMIPSLMAARIQGAQRHDFREDCLRVKAPALVISGEEPLDRVVPVPVTRSYASLIPGAQYAIMKGTGHIGVLTQPAQFARLVGEFVHAHHH
jgi:3-oxoadipate enol-lactonase